ncbi:MAG: NADPH-dependent glutamate synthase [bacterium]
MPRRNRVPMREQDPKERISNFNEVALGYSEEEALLEADRCLQCPKPRCVEGCPVGIDIPAFISLIKERRYREAYKKIKEKDSLPAITGRVCPQENQCEKTCVLARTGEPIAIGRLERFVADHCVEDTQKIDKKPPNGKRVAVVGSGPAGLTVSADLARLGYSVTLFEALHLPGGVLTYGIPDFRLPKDIIRREFEYVKALGVEFIPNVVVGKAIFLDELLKDYGAVFIGSGAGAPVFLNVPGENLLGIFSANEFLSRINLMRAHLFPEYDTPLKVGKKVLVVGGGNVAMDSARVSRRLGAEVTIIYRRSREELPARLEEIKRAEEEGVNFIFLATPIVFTGNNGWVDTVECQEMELGEPDESGRRSPIPKKGSTFTLKVDTVIIAIGNRPNPIISKTTQGLEIGRHGEIIIDPATGKTSKIGVFAGGDIVSGSATVIEAMGAGRRAAMAIHRYLFSGVW